MPGLFLLHRPWLRHGVHARRPAQLPAQGVVRAQQLLHGAIFARVQRCLRLVQQQHVRLVQPVIHQCRNRHGLRRAILRRSEALKLRRVIQTQQQAVVVVQRRADDGSAADGLRVRRANLAGERVVDLRGVLARHGQANLLTMRNVLVVGIAAVGEEQPQAVAVPAQLMHEVVRARAVLVANVDQPHGLQRGEHRLLTELGPLRLSVQLRAAVVGLRIGVTGRIAQEDQPAAGPLEGLQPLQRGGAQRLAARHHHRVVGHLAHLKGRAGLFALRGQQRFADEVEVDSAVEQPVGQALEMLVQLLAHAVGLLGGAPVEPVALHGMNHAHAHHGLAAGQRGVQAGEVILHVGIIAPPRGLIADGRGIVALGLALHGHPGQVLHADGHAQRRLPVAVNLVAAEVEVPAGHAVQLAGHAAAAVLMHGALSLLGGGQLEPGAEHVDARQLEAAIGAHRLAQRRRLAAQRGFLHHVAREHQAVLAAPAAAGVGEGLGEALGDVVVVMIAHDGDLSVRQLPQQLRQMVDQLLAIGRAEGLGQIVRPGQHHVLLLLGKGQRGLVGELGLVGEDGGHRAAKILAHGFEIALVGDLHKALNGRRIQRVGVGLVVVPRVGPVGLHIGVPLAALSRSTLVDARRAGETAVFVQPHVVAGQQSSVLRSARAGGGLLNVLRAGLAVGLGGQQQMPRAILRILRQKAARRAGGPAILVVQPRQHAFLLALFHAGAHQRHVLVAEIGRGHTRAYVHVRAAQAHLPEHLQLPEQLAAIQLAVPRPEGRAAILAARMAEQLGAEVLFR